MLPSKRKQSLNKTLVENCKFQFFTNQKSLFLNIIGLLVFGLIVIYSSTVVHSQNVFNDPYRFVLLQLGWIIIGFFGFFFFYNFNYDYTRTLAYGFMGITLIFLLLLAFSGILPCSLSIPFMPCINEANRWFILNPAPLPQLPLIGEMGFQPSELAKLALILFLGANIPKLIKDKKNPFAFYFVVTATLAGLVMLEPNMSTAVTLFLIGSALYFYSGASLKPIFILAPLAVVFGIVFIFTSPYRKERLLTFMHSEQENSALSSGYQIRQVSIALGNGGIFGVGFGQSKQKYYLPEVSSDSIFAIIGEEFGFVGSIAFLIAYLYLIYQGFEISRRQSDDVKKMLSAGVSTWLAVQLLIHVSANSSLIPFTGVPIPLVSYGGSSMLFTLMGLGVLAGIGKR